VARKIDGWDAVGGIPRTFWYCGARSTARKSRYTLLSQPPVVKWMEYRKYEIRKTQNPSCTVNPMAFQ
jgi:hypothetical protein